MKKLFLYLFMLALVACQDAPTHAPVKRAFYFWKSVFSLSSYEKQRLNDLHINKLYVKYFDVDWDFVKRQETFKAVLNIKTTLPDSIQIIPTVFITNRSFENLKISDLEQFTENIWQKILFIASAGEDTRGVNFSPLSEGEWLGGEVKEIQLDCDWTRGTRQKYFAFLKILKAKMGKTTLSVTIRLHQIKFPEMTGIPPADRGMLMFYNMGDWQNVATPNSILDLKTSEKYVDFIEKYPLSLDVALPIFHQTLWYRNGVFMTFLTHLNKQELQQKTFLKTQNDRFFEVQSDTTIWGVSLRQGDLLRYEEATPEALEKSAAWLASKIPTQSLTLTLFHLDSTQLAPYSHAQLEKTFNLFH